MGSPANEISRDKADNKNFEKHDTSKNHTEGPSNLQQEAYELLSRAGETATAVAKNILNAMVRIVAEETDNNVALAKLPVMQQGNVAVEKLPPINQIVMKNLDSVSLVDVAAGKQTPAVVPFGNRGMAEVAATNPENQKERKNHLPNFETFELPSMQQAPAK